MGNDEGKQKALVLYEMCRRDPHFWLTNFVKTVDQHDSSSPVKPFPNLPYVKLVLDMMVKEDILFIEKSRQIMMSWLCCAFALWTAQFHPYRHILYISKGEVDANDLIKRTRILYDHQPLWLKNLCPLARAWRDQPMDQVVMKNGSDIVSLPKGADKVRGHTASLIFVDEAAFQPEFEETYTACGPATFGGGKIIAISTALSSYFQKLVEE